MEKSEKELSTISERLMKSHKTVMVVEDLKSNFLLVKALLNPYFNIIWAMNGMEAIEKARTENVDLILMDVKMPVMGGLDATKGIREFDKQVPIIALTAYAFDSDREAAKEAGCSAFLAKPLKKQELFATISQVLD